ncbi:MAG: hypothetical protein Q9198_003712, partial [Flavoplaca austrocitrina]
MAVDLPGAPDTESLWKVLQDEINVVTEVPKSWFHVEDFDKSSEAKVNDPKRLLGTRFGNFMNDPFRFDYSFFAISPREAKSIDPQQRVLLQTTYKALEDAGYVPNSTPSFARETFGCYVGNATLDYTDNLGDDIDVYYSPGTLRAFLSGRVSYVFGFSGPSMTVDTACSSSMVSIFHACRALIAGDCRAAVAGGVNVITSPDVIDAHVLPMEAAGLELISLKMYLGLDRAHFLSPSGQCKSFDASADGYCRSEGCGIFVLKKLSAALDESDNILGVIKGPIVREVVRQSGYRSPSNQAHGTGTQAGDPQEAASIRNVLSKDRDSTNPLFLTSIKANIGHCEAASGAAALAKLLLMFQKESIPKQISLQNLNPRIDALGVDGTIIPRQQTDWTSTDGQPRVAMLNNFGAAGSNGALLVQEPDRNSGRSTASELQLRQTYMFGFSAKSLSSLLAYKKILIPFLKDTAETIDLCDFCYTSTARRQIYNYRSSAIASSMGELAEKLEHVDYTEVKRGAVSPVIFVFSGQGSQYISMGKELLHTSAIFRKTVLDCESWLQSSGFPGCLRIIDQEAEGAEDLNSEEDLQAMQTAIFVVEVGLARMWDDIGQYAALVVAGTLELKDALKIVAFRARLMIDQCPLATTGMLAVNGSTNDIQKYISTQSAYQDLSIACCNSPHDCVVGGPMRPLAALKDDLKGKHKYKAALLGNPLAYHTMAMEPILTALTEVAASVKWSAPRVPVICNVLGRVVAKDEASFNADFPARHCRQTVLFQQGVEDALSNYLAENTSHVTWLELGPHPSILPMIKSQPLAKNHRLVAAMRKSVSPWAALSEAQSCVYRSSIPINWLSTFSQSPKPKCTTLPSYQFDYADFLVAYPHESAKDAILSHSASTSYEFLGRQEEIPASSGSKGLVFDTPMQRFVDYITGHIVCGFALCPASVYHEMALAAAAVFDQQEKVASSDGTDSLVNMLSQMTYLNPLLYLEGTKRVVRTTINPSDPQGDAKSFAVSSFDPSDAANVTQHCQGLVRSQKRAAVQSKLTMLQAKLQKPISRFESDDSLEVFRTRAIYEKLFPRVVTYSKMYQVVQSISISADGTEALATVSIPTPHATSQSKFAVNPIFMDVLLHVAGFVANLAAEDDDAFICKEVKSMRVIMVPSDLEHSFTVYCTNTNVAEGSAIVGDGYAMSMTGQLLAVFKGMHFTRGKLRRIEANFQRVSGGNSRDLTDKKTALSNRSSDGRNRLTTDTQPSPTNGATHLGEDVQAMDPKSIISEVCGADGASISPENELAGLGIDSLMILELGSRIQDAFNADFANGELTACVTVGDIEALVLSNNGQPPPANAPPTGKYGDHAAAGFTSQSIESVLVEVCGIEASKITAGAELGSLGIDSLMIFEIEDRLKATYPQTLEGEGLTSCVTVGDVERLVRKAKPVEDIVLSSQSEDEPPRPRLEDRNSSSSDSSGPFFGSNTQLSTPRTRTASTSPHPQTDRSKIEKDVPNPFNLKDPLSRIQPAERGNNAQPLVLVHDGSGLSNKYRSIQAQGRPLWGLSNPKISSDDHWADLDAMARAYADSICPSVKEPLILGGEPLALLPFSPREPHSRGQPDGQKLTSIVGWSFGGVVAFQIAHILMKRNHRVTGVVLIDSPAPLKHQPLPRAIIDAVVGTDTKKPINDAIVRQFEFNTALLTAFHPDAEGPFPVLVLLRSTDGYNAEALDCPPHTWLEDRSDPRKAVEGWEIVVGRSVKVIDIPGNHFNVLDAEN